AQNFKTLSMAEAIKQARIPGIVEVIPSICSMLVEYDRTKLHADSLIGRLKGIEQSMTQLTQIPTRIIDFPILFADPWTTECAEGLGGAFLAIYSVRNPGGYQLLGRTTNPIYDARQRYPDFKENPVLLKPGDILQWRSVDRDGYDRIWAGIEDGTYRFPIRK